MRRHFKTVISLLIIVSSITYIYGDEDTLGTNSNFRLISKDYIDNIDSDLISYEHIGTGAQVIHIKNQDPNKAFAIGFKTPVHDNTGVNHIVEHAVFTGSEKYDIKDVFFEMKKKSPNIFMNASTAVDMTIYPFSTRNQKDYNNLMDIYLDAVFFPNLQKHRHGFDQEGWHYSIDDNNNYHINGVVYNEMKGASVAPRRILAMSNRKAMYPDTMYIYNAGGDPDSIPSLSYRDFKKTHQDYYIPSNSCVFIYGDVKQEEVLAKLNTYYSNFTRSESQDIYQIQNPFRHKKYYSGYYPATSDNDNYYVSNNFAVGEMGDIKLQMSMEILMDILTEYEDSPLRLALQKAKTSKTISYDIDSAIPQPMYSLITTDVKKEDLKLNEKLIEETLECLSKEGLDNKLIKRATNNYQIRSKERLGDISKGIDMAYSIIYGWGHNVSPREIVKSQAYLDEIIEEADSQYFQDLIKNHMLDNSHKSQVVLMADKDYIRRTQEKERLATEQKSKSSNMIKRFFTKNNKGKLEKWQQKEDELGQLPKLSLEDIKEASPLPKLDLRGKDQMYYIADTNGLIYLDLYFDTSYIPQESLNELFLFSHLISQKAKVKSLSHAGDISSSIVAIPKFDDYKGYKPKLRLSLAVEEDELENGFRLIEEIINDPEWDEKWTYKQIQKIGSQYEKYLSSNPLELVELSVDNSKQGASRYEYEKVISFYKYICQLEEDYDKYKGPLNNKLKVINRSIFSKNNIVLGATLEEKNLKNLEEGYKRFTGNLEEKNYPLVEYDFEEGERRQGYEIASDVQYIVWGGNYKEKGGSYRGSLYVLSNIINSEYMLQNIRVKNGAYGAGINFSPYGEVDIYTYQDPRLLESLETIENMPQYIKSIDMDDSMLDEYKIGAISKFEAELGLNENPLVIGRTLQTHYLAGLTNQKLEEIREEIFTTSLEDIQKEALIIDKLIKDKRYSVAGSKNKLLMHTDYFDIIQ